MTASHSLIQEQVRQKRRRWSVTIFLGLAALSGIAGIVWIGLGAGFFVPRSSLFCVADSGKDLRPGMAVKLSGFRIGAVEKLALTDTARVLVTLSIEDHYMKFIRKNSHIRVTRENLVGDSILEVSRGSEDKPLAAPDDTLAFEPAADIEQMVADLRDRALPVIDEVRKMLVFLNDPQGDLRQSLAELHRVTVEVHQTQAQVNSLLSTAEATTRDTGKTVETLLRGVRQQVTQPAGQLLRGLGDTNAQSQKALAQINSRLPALLDKVDQGLGHVVSTTETVDKTLGRNAPVVEDMLGDGRLVARGTHEMVDDLLSGWPFNHPPIPHTATLNRFDSHD